MRPMPPFQGSGMGRTLTQGSASLHPGLTYFRPFGAPSMPKAFYEECSRMVVHQNDVGAATKNRFNRR